MPVFNVADNLDDACEIAVVHPVEHEAVGGEQAHASAVLDRL